MSASWGPECLATDEWGLDEDAIARLCAYEAVLRKWAPRINLVAAGTLNDLWRRHMADSLQLAARVPADAKRIVDIGSGAGFPGLALAIALRGRPGFCVTLVEADARKCAFLRAAAHAADVEVDIVRARAETLDGPVADVVTARACARLSKLLTLAQPFIGPATECLFLKGQDIEAELTEATKYWKMQATIWPSRTSASGAVLALREVRHG